VPRLVFINRNGVAFSIVEIDFAPLFACRHLLAELQSFLFGFKSLVARFANLNSPAIKSDWDNMYFAVHHVDKRLRVRIRVPKRNGPAELAGPFWLPSSTVDAQELGQLCRCCGVHYVLRTDEYGITDGAG
jgi:hypothetical protein